MISDVHMGHLLALMGMAEVHMGHSFVDGGGGAASSCRFSLLTCLTTRNTAKAMIRKSSTVLMKSPYLMTGTPACFASAREAITDPNTVVGADKSGDLRLATLYNFNTETLTLPAFAACVEVGFPSGVNSKGIDTELDGVMTRSFGRWRTHINAGYVFLGSPQGKERSGVYRMVAAVSYPLGYPTSFRDTIIANIFTSQSNLVGQPNPIGLGFGLRHQISSRVVFDTGLGTEFAGPPNRSVFFSTIGLSVGF